MHIIAVDSHLTGCVHFMHKAHFYNIVSKLFVVLFKDAQKKDFGEKYNVFMDICEHFQPVFRYFFMEKFLDPAVWFEKRLAYTHSVATSSIGMSN